MSQEIAGRELVWKYDDTNRVGDHIWWIGSNEALESDYPAWKLTRDIPTILHEIHDANLDRWTT
jgi:CDP-paratose 2-epimerase